MKNQSRQNQSEKSNSDSAPQNQSLGEEKRVETDSCWKLGVVVGIWAFLLLASCRGRAAFVNAVSADPYLPALPWSNHHLTH